MQSLFQLRGAILSFTYSLAALLAPKGTLLNAVAPRLVIIALQAGSRPAEEMQGLGVGVPLQGRAGQLAKTASGPDYGFLASSDLNMMTGQAIYINSQFFVALCVCTF